ncbi:hypothetical protein P7C70_g4168, partial [Phenoliferia sp. Uapishka_3]
MGGASAGSDDQKGERRGGEARSPDFRASALLVASAPAASASASKGVHSLFAANGTLAGHGNATAITNTTTISHNELASTSTDSSSGAVQSSTGTYFVVDPTSETACNTYLNNNEHYTVAINSLVWDDSDGIPDPNVCGKKISVTNTATGITVIGTIRDNSAQAAWTALSQDMYLATGADLDYGEFPMTYFLLNATGTNTLASANATTSAVVSSSIVAGSSSVQSSTSVAVDLKASSLSSVASSTVESTSSSASESSSSVKTSSYATPTPTPTPTSTYVAPTTTSSSYDWESAASVSSASAYEASVASQSSADQEAWASQSSKSAQEAEASSKSAAEAWAYAASTSSAAAAAASSKSQQEQWAAEASSSSAQQEQWAEESSKSAAAAKAKATQSSSSGSSGSGKTYTGGQATYFYQNGVAGACGTVHKDTDYVAALQTEMYANGANCGKTITLTSTATGQSVTVTVADECPTCDGTTYVDLSESAFLQIGTVSEGMVPMTWQFDD